MVATVSIGSDHGGFELKAVSVPIIRELGFLVEDAGCFWRERVDYPDCVRKVIEALIRGRVEFAVLFCTWDGHEHVPTDIGAVELLCATMRRRQCWRQHNDANVLCMGAQFVDSSGARSILAFLTSSFAGDARHVRRLKLDGVGKLYEFFCFSLRKADPEVYQVLEEEFGDGGRSFV